MIQYALIFFTQRLAIVYNWPKVGYFGVIWPDLNLYLAKSGVFCIFVAKYNTIMVGSQLKRNEYSTRFQKVITLEDLFR